MSAYRKPRLASQYYVRFEPPDERGDEVLHFTSETRRVTIKGHSFREFQQHVIPLLDGTHTIVDITAAVADVFAPADVIAGLRLLAEQQVLEDAADDDLAPGQLAATRPQHNLLLDLGADPREVRQRLARSSVSVVGLGGAGATAAVALARAGVGTVRLVDAGAVTPADPYLAATYSAADVGEGRAQVVARAIERPETRAMVATGPFDTDDDVREAVGQSDFVICGLDPGQSALIYRLNRVCLQAGIRWMAVTPAAVEVSVGPLIEPYETACYMCYRMRAVACAEDPEGEFAFQSFLDRRRHDDSATRENLVFGTTTAGQLAALEAFKVLTRSMPVATRGAVVVIDLLTLASTKHVVLRKPWCPACHGGRSAASAANEPATPATLAVR